MHAVVGNVTRTGLADNSKHSKPQASIAVKDCHRCFAAKSLDGTMDHFSAKTVVD